MTGHGNPAAGGAALKVLSWNLFHGRDAPPNKELFTWQSRLLGRSEDDGAYIQLNRPLDDEFIGWIAARDWQLCLLQECPPRWAQPLAAACAAQGLRVLTSRNQLSGLRAAVARRNPDLMASGEGGSNLILVRRPWTVIAQERQLLNPLPARALRERRVLGFARLALIEDPQTVVCVANMHCSAGRPKLAEAEVRRAAARTLFWAGDSPLLLGGDFNLRPGRTGSFDDLEAVAGLRGATGPDAVDHLLTRDLDVVERARQLPASEREMTLEEGGVARVLRLSDHPPLVAQYRVASSRS